MSTRFFPYAFALLSMVSLAHCAPEHRSPTPNTSTRTNRCMTDNDCPAGNRCDRGSLACVAAEARTEVLLSASPPSGVSTETATPTTLDARVLQSSGESIDISMRAPRVVLGSVLAPAQPGPPRGTAPTPPTPLAAAPISATVSFRRRGATPAERAGVVSSGTTRQTLSNGRMFAFTLGVVPGVYDVTVTPEDPRSYPPYVLSEQTVAPDLAPLILELVYSSLVEVSGTIVDQDTGLPIPGLSVRVVEPAADRALRSTIAETDNYGAFRVRLSPGASQTDWALEVSLGSESGDWKCFYEVSRRAVGAERTYTNLPPLRVPWTAAFARRAPEGERCEGCASIEATVEGAQEDGTPMPLSGATVQFRAVDVLGTLPTEHRSWFEARVASQEGGELRAQLMPGTYDVTIVPAEGERFAVSTQRLTIPNTNPVRGRVLGVRRRAQVAGTIRDGSRGMGLRGVTVEAVPLGALLPSSATPLALRLARTSRATTDAEGGYSLSLDPGSYRLVLRPPEGSGYAAQVQDETLVIADPTTSSNPSGLGTGPAIERDFVLGAPIVTRGAVLDSEGAALGGALVRAYVRIPVAGASNPLDLELGRATADARGVWSLLLPPATLR